MAQSLRFGIVHDFRCPPGSDVTMPQVYAETFEQVVLAEQLGMELCWFTEHHFMADGYLPNFVPVAGAAAALTSSIRFSTDICLMPFRDPVRLAEDLAVLDNISGGRMELGIGMGYAAHEFAGFGLPLSRRVSLTEEPIEILRLAWSGEPFSYEGKRYTYRDLRVTPEVVQPGGPPLWVAATSVAGALRAARFDTNLLPQGPKAAVLEPWKEALAADGRDPGDKRVGIIRGVYVTDGSDPADDPTWEAVAAAEKYRRGVYIGIIKASTDHKQTARERSARTGPRQPDPLNPLVWTVGDADHDDPRPRRNRPGHLGRPARPAAVGHERLAGTHGARCDPPSPRQLVVAASGAFGPTSKRCPRVEPWILVTVWKYMSCRAATATSSTTGTGTGWGRSSPTTRCST